MREVVYRFRRSCRKDRWSDLEKFMHLLWLHDLSVIQSTETRYLLSRGQSTEARKTCHPVRTPLRVYSNLVFQQFVSVRSLSLFMALVVIKNVFTPMHSAEGDFGSEIAPERRT